MKSECPKGHTENLSYEELYNRLMNNDFECREENCNKKLSYEIDERFWREKVTPKIMGWQLKGKK